MATSRRARFIFIAIFLISLVRVFGSTCWPTDKEGLSAEAARQIHVYDEIKRRLSPSESKISMVFIMELLNRQGDPLRSLLTSWAADIENDSIGRVVADVHVDDPSDIVELLAFFAADVVSEGQGALYSFVRVAVPLENLPKLAERRDVVAINPPQEALRVPRRPIDRAGSGVPNRWQSRVTNRSEGDIAHGADVVRSQFRFDGTGVKVGVISDGVDSLAAVQGSGDLPAVTTLPGLAGVGDEGTAMLEIVHDLARGADLVFATAGSDPNDLADALDALAGAGCQVVASDMTFFPSPYSFYPSPWEKKINLHSDSGMFTFTPASNQGSLARDTTGVWEGDYSPYNVAAGNYHAFDGVSDIRNEITTDAMEYLLVWSDPVGGVPDMDYDLLLFEGGGGLVTSGSQVPQSPAEYIPSSADDTGRELVVRKNSGSLLRYIRVSARMGGQTEYQTEGAITGGIGAQRAFTVAAVDIATAGGGSFSGGASNPVEDFSADGKRRLFYDMNGQPITPGDLLATGGTVLSKPDFAAADTVSTATPGFNPFSGTSAAVAHAAAIAALVLEQRPGLTRLQLASILNAASLDIESLGWDVNSGHGVLRADLAVSVVHADGFEGGETTEWSDTGPQQ